MLHMTTKGSPFASAKIRKTRMGSDRKKCYVVVISTNLVVHKVLEWVCTDSKCTMESTSFHKFLKKAYLTEENLLFQGTRKDICWTITYLSV